ncbi:MAG: hypothetical protein ACM3Q4_05175 [Acidobacteriota bacterium]
MGSGLGSPHAFMQLDALTNAVGLWCSLDNQCYLGAWNCECSVDGETLRPVETEFLPESQMTLFEHRGVQMRKRLFIPAFDADTDELNAAVMLLQCSNLSNDERLFTIVHDLSLPDERAKKRFLIRLFQNRCEIENAAAGTEASLFTSAIRWKQCRVSEDGHAVTAEYEERLAAHGEASFSFFFFFSPEGKAALPEELPDAAELLERSSASYRRLLGRAQLVTPDDVINRGLQWAVVNTARVQRRSRKGWTVSNSLPQESAVLRSCAWYLFGSDWCTPAFSRRLIDCCLVCTSPEEEFAAGDAAPIFICGLYHYALTQGDRAFLAGVYDTMKQVCDRIIARKRDGLVVYSQTEAVIQINSECVRALDVTSRAARVLGFEPDAAYYSRESEALKESVNAHLASPPAGAGSLNTGSRTDLLSAVLFDVPDEKTRRRILDRVTADELAPNLAAWAAYCVREEDPGRLVEGMRTIYRLSDSGHPKKYGNVVPGEFPERLPGETSESRGAAMSPWMPPLYLWLGIEGLFGIAPKFTGLEVEPAMPEGWEWLAIKDLRMQGASLSMFVHQGVLYTTGEVKSTYPVRKGGEVRAGCSDPSMTVIAIELDEGTALFAHADADTEADVEIETAKERSTRHVSLKAHSAEVFLLSILLLLFVFVSGADAELRAVFANRYGPVEVGGSFAGAAFHESRPLPTRISFFYPVANSVDLNDEETDGHAEALFALGVKKTDSPFMRLGTEGWNYVLSPHTVLFSKDTAGASYSIRYQFCVTQPAMVVTYTITNTSKKAGRYEVLTQAALTLRTSRTYARKTRAVMRIIRPLGAVVARFNAADADSSSLFVMNAGDAPSSVMVDTVVIAGAHGSPQTRGPMCAFRYVKDLGPGDSLRAVQVIGSCRSREDEVMLEQVRMQWKADVESYDTFVHLKICQCRFITGDSVLDRSAAWAAAVLAANRHYINGAIMPMPCPASDNFFLTEEALRADLGAVQFDTERVKRDLSYIVSLARDSVIPHAYYWRDDGMKTDVCEPGDWSHFWFILASASYIRHTQDDSAALRLFPFMRKSISFIRSRITADGMQASTAALTLRAIGEYCYLASRLGEPAAALQRMEEEADSLRKTLTERLWDPEIRYLINIDGSARHRHIYARSLVAGAYGVLDREMSLKMAETAGKAIVDSGFGLRTSVAGIFLQSLYRIYGIQDNEWNISLTGMPREGAEEVHFPLTFTNGDEGKGGPPHVSLITTPASWVIARGRGRFLEHLQMGERLCPSAVLPLDAAAERDTIRIRYGSCRSPYLERVNAVLHRAEMKNEYAEFSVSSFEGHKTQARFICPEAPKKIVVDGREVSAVERKENGAMTVDISYTASAGRQMLRVFY